RSIALKTLLRFDPDSLYLFKQEFRALADVHHRNLVRLHELVHPEAGPIFFTMELVDGSNFLDYVRGHKSAGDGGSSTSPASNSSSATVTLPVRARAKRISVAPSDPSVEPTRFDPDRLRPALRQLVQGLAALHTAGKLHRDVKPSNILVSTGGRVVILDFGIAIELSRAVEDAEQGTSGLVGTPAYVSPEQAAGEAPTAASDWYAVGVILYEALAGRRPFIGSSADVLTCKLTENPPPPGALARGIPPDLEALCVDLLNREPSQRPDGAEILRRLGAIGSRRPPPLRPGDADEDTASLVGRDDEIRALRGAFDAVAGGQAVTVRVGGGAGMGKSTLIQRFLDDLHTTGEAEILTGRAYERESVPYKAVDALIDSLTRSLVRIEDLEGPVARPRHASALAKLFPVVKRVPSLADLPDVPVDDVHRVRRRAFRALRELVATLARRRPLVLYVDDVQWGDVDSVSLLHEVMRPPSEPPVLLLLTYREEEAATSPFIQEMSERWDVTADVREVRVGPLGLADAQRLALARLGEADEAARRTARAVAREARGSPFLIEELVRGNRAPSTTDATLALLTLSEVIADRLDRLPLGARRLAEVVAIAGRPLPLPVLAAACQDGDASEDHVELLRDERLVRVGFREGGEVVEPSHDRIRETIVDQVPGETLRTHHGGIANALEAAASVDLEALADHLIGSGAVERGAAVAARAAEQAASKLAFDQAVRLYRLALETHPRSDDEARPIRIALAKALHGAGRGAEAARVYLEAANHAERLVRVGLERAAAAQLLASGRTDEGTEVLRRVLAAVDLTAPRSALGAILSLLLHRFLLGLRGFRFEERSPEQVSPEDRLRVDALNTVAVGFSVVDIILGACMQARALRMALAFGDRRQVMRAAGVQITHLASQGGPIQKAEQDAHDAGERLLGALGEKELEAHFAVCRGLALYHRGRYKDALGVLHSRIASKNQNSESSAHGPLFAVYALFYLGRLREQARRAKHLLEDAERRGDLYTAVNLRAAPLVDASLVADDPDAAREHIRVALETWTQRGFHLQHWKTMVWGAQIDLYEGEGERAYMSLVRSWRAYRRSFLGHAQSVRVLTDFIRGCAAVASAIEAPADVRAARLKEAAKIARSLEREDMPWIRPLESMLRAATAHARGDAATAERALRDAIERASAADMSVHAWCAKRQLGRLLGGEDGDRLVGEADAAMKAEDVRAPARMAGMFVPGKWGSSG
ncbi:MAG TPA: AAA family ATPase, partial [Polyangiaceae bacterium]|nr:AAA family ATPase [Polyangiaceae bacterium]